MGHSASTNYSVSEVQLTNITSGNGLPNAVRLYITPSAGYVVGEQDFTIGTWPTSAPNGIPGVLLPTMVTFGNYDSNEPIASIARVTGVAYDPDNIIEVYIYLDPQATITVNTEILIDIDQLSVHTVSSRSIQTCLTSQTMQEGSCPVSSWPSTGNPIDPGMSQTPLNLCQSLFIDVKDASIVTNSPQPTNTTWSNPLSNIAGYVLPANSGTADVSQYEANLTPNLSTVLFEKTYWTAPQYSFEVVPFYQLNAAASNSGYYTIQETPTDYNVDKTLVLDTNGSNVVFCDTTDVMRGMQVTGPTLVSCSYDPIANPTPGANVCWPLFGADIRVKEVDHANSRVMLTETNTLSSGDVLNFSTMANTAFGGNYNTVPRCVAKKFTVKFLGNTDVPCSDHHVIDWAHSGSLTPLAQGTQPLIINTNFNTNNVDPAGETRTVTISGTKLAAGFSLTVVRDDDFYHYDFDRNTFTSGFSGVTSEKIGSTGYYSTGITFPQIVSDKAYTVTITPLVTENTWDTTIASADVVLQYKLNQHTSKTVTFSTTATGFVVGGNLGGTVQTGIGGANANVPIVAKSGAVTKSDGAVLYLVRSLRGTGGSRDIDGEPRGDFKVGNNNLSKSYQGKLTPTLTGSGTASLTVGYTGIINKFPTENIDVSLVLDSLITVKPTVPDKDTDSDEGLLVSIETGFIDIDVRGFDTDGNAENKVLSTEKNPSLGTLTAYGASGSAWDDGRIRYSIAEGVVVEPGSTDSFVYKATVGGVDGEEEGNGTITVKFK